MKRMENMLKVYTEYLNSSRETISNNVKKIYKLHGIKFHNQKTATILSKDYYTVASYFKTDGNKILFDDLLKIAIELNEPIENFMIV